MFKKTKLYVGVALIVNAVTSLITFIILLFKKKRKLLLQFVQ